MPCSGSRLIVPNELSTLADRCWISLGDNDSGIELRAHVPADYVPSRSKSEMKWAYIPEWMTQCNPSGTSDFEKALRFLKYNSESVPDLFWSDGQGFYHRALLHAILTLYGYRETATAWRRMADSCRVTADVLADAIETERNLVHSTAADSILSPHGCGDHFGTIEIDLRGQVRASKVKDDYVAHALGKQVYLCAKWFKVEAALADYYSWWAHRLYSWWEDGHGSLLDYYVGWMCVRAALSEIVELSCIILHEFAHVKGSYYHCSSEVAEAITGIDDDSLAWWATLGVGVLLWPWTAVSAALLEELLVGSHDGPQDCCQYGLDRAFRVRMWARLGLPRPHF